MFSHWVGNRLRGRNPCSLSLLSPYSDLSRPSTWRRAGLHLDSLFIVQGDESLRNSWVQHHHWGWGRDWCFFFESLFVCLFIYLWLCWVLVSVRRLSPVVAREGHSSSRCAGLSLSRPLLLRSTGSRRAGSVIVAHGPICCAACGIFPYQDSNPCPVHWQADSQPLRHQGSPGIVF